VRSPTIALARINPAQAQPPRAVSWSPSRVGGAQFARCHAELAGERAVRGGQVGSGARFCTLAREGAENGWGTSMAGATSATWS